MSILVSSYLLKQASNNKGISNKTISAICKELATLDMVQKNGHNSMREYLNKQNGKKLKGLGNNSANIFKYRLTNGDRILYTYGDYINSIRDGDKYKSDWVILKYAKHDDQDNIKGQELEKFDFVEYSKSNLHTIEDKDITDMGINIETLDETYFENFHSFYVINDQDENIENRTINELDVYLTEKQNDIVNDFIKHRRPAIITGGAGTGKTVILLHILNDIKLIENNAKSIYFTQSNALVENAKKKYDYIVNMSKNKEGNTVFWNLNEYCIEKLQKSRANFVETVYDFESFIDKYKDKEKFSKKYELSTVNLWAEIRGVIKGGLNNNMARGNDSEQSGKVNPKTRMLSLEEYESLSDDNTIVPKEIRKKVYKLCVEYDKWLKENNKYDENDLIMEMLKMENESFDLVAIDEVQDYTELQIYYMCSLAKNKNNVVMDGDIHQIINPNVFNDRRIKTLFNNVQEYALNYNHRCTTEIIDCVNALSSLRVKKIGKRKGEEYGECKVSGRKPIDFKYTKDNIKRLIDKLLEYPGAMILVPDTETKKRLIAEYGQEKYKKKKHDIISTVSDIKGMEYKYIVCYNLTGKFSDKWNEICGYGIAKKNTKYRYYFNLFYVGITRAQQFLCIMNENKVDYLEKELSKQIDKIAEYNEYSLGISNLSNSRDEWLLQAEIEFANGRYREAKESYLKCDGDNKKILKCDMEIAKEEKRYKNVLELALILDDKETIKRISREVGNNEPIRKIVDMYVDIKNYSLKNGYRKNSLFGLINKAFKDYDADIRNEIISRIIKILDNRLIEIITNLKGCV